MNAPAAEGSFTSRPQPGGVRIEIPTVRNWFVLVFLPFWLCGWALGEAALIWKLHAVFKEGGGLDLIMSLWLAGWTLGGLFAWVVLFWFLVGLESIEVSESVLTISQKIGPFIRRKEFDPLRLRDLRLAPLEADGENPMSSFVIRGYGLIAFDYGSRTHRFGAVSDVGEALRIHREIARWLPPGTSVSQGG
jgi:hypothetical protein